MASGKVEVELRILGNKVKSDMQAIKKTMDDAVRGISGGSASTNDPVVRVQEERTKKVKATNNSLKEQARLIREGKNLGANPNISLGAASSRGGASAWSTNAGGGLATAPSPTLMKGGGKGHMMTPEWFLAQAQARAKAMGPLNAGQKGTSIAGMFGNLINFQMSPIAATATKVAGAVAGLRVAFGLVGFVAAHTVGRIMELSRAMMAHFARAAEAGRAMYAKQLQSGGLPGGFVAGRSLMAEMLGVGENEIMRYGNAVAYLNEKIRFAQGVYVQTTPALASAAWELKALNNDLKAIAMLVAAEFAPAMRQIVYALRQIIEFVGGSFAKGLAAAFKWALESAIRTVAGHAGVIAYKTAQKHIGGKIDPGTAPAIQASSARMPASAWEKMGLVLGTSGRGPMQKVAENTGKTARILERMAKGMPRGESGLKMFNNPSHAHP